MIGSNSRLIPAAAHHRHRQHRMPLQLNKGAEPHVEHLITNFNQVSQKPPLSLQLVKVIEYTPFALVVHPRATS